MAAIVEVKLELGHRAKVREVPSEEGHTHDWIVFVKGSDGIKLEHFVEKIVFWLHESYDPSKRVIRRPPYKVEESGFAGFIILIDVHFRNHEEPKMVRFQYDLFLLMESMPPVNHTRLEKLTFTNPTEDFRKKLLKAGALLINPPSASSKVSSKERSGQPTSPSSKKDRSRSKDSSKHRDGSNHRSHEEKKRSSSSHSVRKDGRIPGKDMKKHEDEFKHPKLPDHGRTHKDSSGSEKVEHERGRSEKRRSHGIDDGNKKKKKKHSEDHASPSQQSRPKTLTLSSGSGPLNPPKKEKEKVRKIREKPDLMAGLFAPENSINMTQVKQSREKGKHDPSEAKVKKDKKATTNAAMPRRSVSPHPNNNEETTVTHSSKISPGGNLTLKIKKERITSLEEKKQGSSNPPSKPKKKEHTEKEKKRSKDSADTSSKSKTREREQEHKKRRTPVASSSSSLSSPSGSDMDISTDSDSSKDEFSRRKNKITTNIALKTEKTERNREVLEYSRESPKVSHKPEKKASSSIPSHDRAGKVKSEWERPKGSPKTPTERREKPRRDSTSHGEKSSSSTKHKKSSKEEQTFSLNKSNTEAPSTHKSKKRSSKEKLRQSSERTAPSTLPSVKKEKRSTTPNSTPAMERVNIKKEPKYETLPPVSCQAPRSPGSSTKMKRSPKPSSILSKEKDRNERKQNSSHRKLSTGSNAKPSLQQTEKPKPVFKSRSYVETSSDSDSDVEPPLKDVSLHLKQEEFARKDSVTSQSSSSSQGSPGMSPDGVEKNRDEQQQEYHYSPKDSQHSPPSSISASSDDEEMAMREIPTNTSTLSVLSPIRDQSSSYIQNPVNSVTAYQDMEMSESSDDDNSDPPPAQENVQDRDPPSRIDEDHHRPLQNIGIPNDDYSSSDDDEGHTPPEKPFQHHQDSLDQNTRSSTSHQQDSPNVIILAGDSTPYPHMTESFYRELQELQKRISYVTDVDRLRKIARIVAKSQKLLKNDDYFDFDLCSLDSRTIHKIQKQLEAV